MNIDSQKRLNEKRRSLQRALAAWLDQEEVPLHGVDIDSIALEMAITAEKAFSVHVSKNLFRRRATING